MSLSGKDLIRTPDRPEEAWEELLGAVYIGIPSSDSTKKKEYREVPKGSLGYILYQLDGLIGEIVQ